MYISVRGKEERGGRPRWTWRKERRNKAAGRAVALGVVYRQGTHTGSERNRPADRPGQTDQQKPHVIANSIVLQSTLDNTNYFSIPLENPAV